MLQCRGSAPRLRTYLSFLANQLQPNRLTEHPEGNERKQPSQLSEHHRQFHIESYVVSGASNTRMTSKPFESSSVFEDSGQRW